jgi:signal transduction histidine kinase
VVNVFCRREQHATARVAIEDRGIGIPADKLEKIFQDYYRTQEAAQHNPSSTGLGLAVVRQVAHLLRMSVTVESAPGWGTRFTLLVPTCTSHVEDS